MKNECGKLHIPNYSVSCCLRHLLEMAKYAEMQTKIKKYSNRHVSLVPLNRLPFRSVRPCAKKCGEITQSIEKNLQSVEIAGLWRSGWDSNPRAREGQRFSRPPRYDRFDTTPYEIFQAAAIAAA